MGMAERFPCSSRGLSLSIEQVSSPEEAVSPHTCSGSQPQSKTPYTGPCEDPRSKGSSHLTDVKTEAMRLKATSLKKCHSEDLI